MCQLYPRGFYDFTQIRVDSLASGLEVNLELNHVRAHREAPERQPNKIGEN